MPRTYPVEVVFNGTNLGIYAFSETVKIGEGRLEINEQPDLNEDLATIDDGWLIEIDNTYDTPQIEVYQNATCAPGPYQPKAFTIKTPEELSDVQTKWITEQLEGITKALYVDDIHDTSWMEYFDIPLLARYYIVQEFTGNYDAFVGSTYFYHTAGGKWMAGPLWDSEWTFVTTPRYDYSWKEREDLNQTIRPEEDKIPAWIERMLKFPAFRDAVRAEWLKFYYDKNEDYGQGDIEFHPDNIAHLKKKVEKFYQKTLPAYETNSLIWPEYSAISPSWSHHIIMNYLDVNPPIMNKLFFCNGSGVDSVITEGGEIQYPADVYSVSGMRVATVGSREELSSLPAGIYIAGGKKIVIK